MDYWKGNDGHGGTYNDVTSAAALNPVSPSSPISTLKASLAPSGMQSWNPPVRSIAAVKDRTRLSPSPILASNALD